jgi:adenylate kinase
MKILLLGPQGSGKGTLGRKLSEKLGVALIGSGKLLRNVKEDNPNYKTINEYMDRGDLVPQEIVADLIKEEIRKRSAENDYILEGWCRAMIDIEIYDPNVDLVLYIDIPREESIRRITGRRTCSSDGQIYNIYTLPKEELEKCEGDLIQREDDTEEAVNHRLQIFYSETQEVIDYYEKMGILVKIDGMGTPEEVLDRALKVIND